MPALGIFISTGPISRARLAQSVEHQTFNLRVMGSSPISGAQFVLYFGCQPFLLSLMEAGRNLRKFRSLLGSFVQCFAVKYNVPMIHDYSLLRFSSMT